MDFDDDNGVDALIGLICRDDNLIYVSVHV